MATSRGDTYKIGVPKKNRQLHHPRVAHLNLPVHDGAMIVEEFPTIIKLP